MDYGSLPSQSRERPWDLGGRPRRPADPRHQCPFFLATVAIRSLRMSPSENGNELFSLPLPPHVVPFKPGMISPGVRELPCPPLVRGWQADGV